MNKLSIKLNKDYKSFKSGFEYIFEGNLIILSGINGGGKSQIINIIHNQDGKNRKSPIDAKTRINEEELNRKDILYKSFKESISIPEIGNASTQNSINSKNQVWQHYERHLLDSAREECLDFSESCEEAKNILINKFGPPIFNAKKISQEDLKKTIPEDFIWKFDDVFTNIVGEMFFNYAAKVHNGCAEAGRVSGPAFDEKSLGIAPWDDLNTLFEEVGLEYRFKDNYRLTGLEINEQPKLFAIKEDKSIDENEPRRLSDLSDGEKAIISFSFASLSGIKQENKKILLLDEFDATLNPSLTEIFFKILDKYFLSKGIIVLIATHAPTTISLAPKNTSFYEVYKNKKDRPRILQINRDAYAELQKVNERFFKKIADQETRIEKILNSSLNNLIKDKDNILVITEGKTDWKYILKALQYFHNKDEFLEIKEKYFMRFGSKEDVDNNVCGTNVKQEMGDKNLENFLINLKNSRQIDDALQKSLRIGIYDSDNKGIKSFDETAVGVISFKISPENISTELLFTDNEIKQEIDGKRLYIGDEFDEITKKIKGNASITIGGHRFNNFNKAGKRKIIEADVFNEENTNIAIPKELFAKAVFNEKIRISDTSWEKFRHIFKKIKMYIPSK